MRQYYNIFICTTVASIFPNCVLATSVMGVLILSHPMSLYNYYITTTKNIIISSSSSSHYHQEHHIIIIIIRHENNDCRVKPHTDQTAYDDDISNSIDVQILWKILQSHCHAILYTWSQLSSLGGLNFGTPQPSRQRPSRKSPAYVVWKPCVPEYISRLTIYAAFNIICRFQLYIPMLTIYIESCSLWHHHNHPHFKSHQYLDSFRFSWIGIKQCKVT